jgi:hypothetical protein
MFGLLPTFLGAGGGGTPPVTEPRRRRTLDLSRSGMHIQTVGPVTYTPAAISLVRFGTLSSANVVQSGTGPYTYTLAVAGGPYSLTNSNLKFPASVAASMTVQRVALPSAGATDDYFSLGFDVDNTTIRSAPTTPTQGGVGTQGSFWYYPFKSGSFGSAGDVTGVGSFCRIRRDASNVLYFESSPDNVTWTTMDTNPGANVDYWPKMQMNTAASTGAAWLLHSQTGMV